MRLWLDDDPNRAVPPGFDIVVRTAKEAIDWIASGEIDEISLDHDLGLTKDLGYDPGTGYDVAKWVEEQAYKGALPRIKWSVHSANPAGASRMKSALQSAERFWHQHEQVAREASGGTGAIYELVRTMPPTEDGVMIDTLNRANGDEEDNQFSEQDALAAAEEIGLDWDKQDFSPKDLAKGMDVELEHGTRFPDANVTDDDPVATAKIALAHLYEFGDYYDRLEKMEAEGLAAKKEKQAMSNLPQTIRYKGSNYHLGGRGRMPLKMRQGWDMGEYAEYTIPETGEHALGRIIWFVKKGEEGAAIVASKAVKDDNNEWWPVIGQQESLIMVSDLSKPDVPIAELMKNLKPKVKELKSEDPEVDKPIGNTPTLFLFQDPAGIQHYVDAPGIPTASADKPRTIQYKNATYYIEEAPRVISFQGARYVLADSE